MSDPHKNRFSLEGDAYDPADAPAFESSGPVYLDEPDPRHRRNMRYRLALIAGILMLVLVAGTAVWYFAFYQPGAGETAGTDQEFERVGETLRDRYYLPNIADISPELARAIELYRNHERDAAKRAFEKFVGGEAADREKAIALNYLGIMALETERYTQAKQHFFRAFKFDPESVAALVNLANVERRLGNASAAKDYAQKAKELAPRDRDVALLLGNILNEGQDPDAAIESYQEGLEQSPNDPLLLYNTALSLLRQEKYEEALLYFARAARSAEAGSIAVQSYAHMGQIYFKQNNLEMAADHLRKAVSLAPDNGKNRYNLGVVYLRMNRNSEALGTFEAALESGANDTAVYRALARAFQKLDQPSMAIRSLEKSLYLKADDLDTLFQLGDLYYRERDLLNAARVFRRIANITPADRNGVDAMLKLAAVYTDLEQYNDAVEVLERAAGYEPSNPQIYYTLGVVYERAGRPDLAVRHWRTALESRGSDGKPALEREDERRIRFAIAETHRREGAYELALREYRRVQERNTEAPRVLVDPELDMAIGRTYMALKDYSQAIASLEKVAQSLTGGGDIPVERGDRALMLKDAHLNLAQAYSRRDRDGDQDQARSHANRAVRMDATDQDARILQAFVLMKQNTMADREKAIEILKSAVRSDVDARTASRAHNLLGMAYMENGEYGRALSSFDQAVRLDPGNSEAVQNRRAAANAYENEL